MGDEDLDRAPNRLHEVKEDSYHRQRSRMTPRDDHLSNFCLGSQRNQEKSAEPQHADGADLSTWQVGHVVQVAGAYGGGEYGRILGTKDGTSSSDTGRISGSVTTATSSLAGDDLLASSAGGAGRDGGGSFNSSSLRISPQVNALGYLPRSTSGNILSPAAAVAAVADRDGTGAGSGAG
ncbi:unnamed protein product, partial [Discosporangium mesarthrocarpum]